MIKESTQRLKYVLSDFVMSNAAWLAYNCLRYHLHMARGQWSSLADFLGSGSVLLGQLVFPLAMMVVYYLSGYYNEVFRKSRLSELGTTFSSAVVNSLVAFFVALINDMTVIDRTYNYEVILILLGLLFVMVYVPRAIITNHTSRMIKSRRWSFKTLVVGDGAAAVAFVSKMQAMRQSLGYDVVGHVHIAGETPAATGRPVWSLDDIEQVCRDNGIKEIIVVPTTGDSELTLGVINRLFPLNLPIKLTPSKFNTLTQRARLSDFYGDPLIDVSGSSMTEGQKNVKHLLDVLISAVLVVLLMPVYAVVALLIKCDSPRGPVFYLQERVGWHNRPFKIIKFRTMVTGAEQPGAPQLSSEDDPRVTRVGRVLRKYRIDELPQFINVLKGDMAIVGPRPERKYFADQIMQRVPAYSLVHQIRPGITSLGMVKYGYACNVDEMLERLHFDLLYLENMSLINDLKIIVYTIRIVLLGRGL